MGKHVAIYVRASSCERDIAGQGADMLRWSAEEHPLPVKWYRDGFTGATGNRPGFERLMKAVRLGEVGTLAVWRLDRLGRTARDLAVMFEELAAHAVRLASVGDGAQLAPADVRSVALALVGVAQYEAEVRAAGITAAGTWRPVRPARRARQAAQGHAGAGRDDPPAEGGRREDRRHRPRRGSVPADDLLGAEPGRELERVMNPICVFPGMSGESEARNRLPEVPGP